MAKMNFFVILAVFLVFVNALAGKKDQTTLINDQDQIVINGYTGYPDQSLEEADQKYCAQAKLVLRKNKPNKRRNDWIRIRKSHIVAAPCDVNNRFQKWSFENERIKLKSSTSSLCWYVKIKKKRTKKGKIRKIELKCGKCPKHTNPTTSYSFEFKNGLIVWARPNIENILYSVQWNGNTKSYLKVAKHIYTNFGSVEKDDDGGE